MYSLPKASQNDKMEGERGQKTKAKGTVDRKREANEKFIFFWVAVRFSAKKYMVRRYFNEFFFK
jgi:hypothetical protein